MAVPQRLNLRASGTGIVASAGLPYCKATSSKTLQDQLTITELSSWLSDGLRQHSQEWLCHKDQISEPVAQAWLPVRIYLTVRPQAGKTLQDQLTITELSSWLSHGLRQHSQEWLCHKD